MFRGSPALLFFLLFLFSFSRTLVGELGALVLFRAGVRKLLPVS